MANLLLTKRCNLHCTYCFAAPDVSEPKKPQDYVSPQVFRDYLTFLERSESKQARFLGGEPTLHPDFDAFVLQAWQKGKHVVVFTNGLMPDKALKVLEDLPEEACSLLVNLTPLDPAVEAGYRPSPRTISSEAAQSRAKRVVKTLFRMGERAQLGYTIFHNGPLDLSWIIEMIDQTGCNRSIRLGMAQPAPGGNVFIHPKNYRQVGRQVASFIEKAAEAEVKVELDCGFVRCMFSDEELQILRESQAHIAWRCSPVVDIDLDGSAFPCFPLAAVVRIRDALSQDVTALQVQFEQALAYFRVCGIYPECSTCDLRITEKCSGGCLALTLRRMKNQTLIYTIPNQYAADFSTYRQRALAQEAERPSS